MTYDVSFVSLRRIRDTGLSETSCEPDKDFWFDSSPWSFHANTHHNVKQVDFVEGVIDLARGQDLPAINKDEVLYVRAQPLLNTEGTIHYLSAVTESSVDGRGVDKNPSDRDSTSPQSLSVSHQLCPGREYRLRKRTLNPIHIFPTIWPALHTVNDTHSNQHNTHFDAIEQYLHGGNLDNSSHTQTGSTYAQASPQASATVNFSFTPPSGAQNHTTNVRSSPVNVRVYFPWAEEAEVGAPTPDPWKMQSSREAEHQSAATRTQEREDPCATSLDVSTSTSSQSSPRSATCTGTPTGSEDDFTGSDGARSCEENVNEQLQEQVYPQMRKLRTSPLIGATISQSESADDFPLPPQPFRDVSASVDYSDSLVGTNSVLSEAVMGASSRGTAERQETIGMRQGDICEKFSQSNSSPTGNWRDRPPNEKLGNEESVAVSERCERIPAGVNETILGSHTASNSSGAAHNDANVSEYNRRPPGPPTSQEDFAPSHSITSHNSETSPTNRSDLNSVQSAGVDEDNNSPSESLGGRRSSQWCNSGATALCEECQNNEIEKSSSHSHSNTEVVDVLGAERNDEDTFEESSNHAEEQNLCPSVSHDLVSDRSPPPQAPTFQTPNGGSHSGEELQSVTTKTPAVGAKQPRSEESTGRDITCAKSSDQMARCIAPPARKQCHQSAVRVVRSLNTPASAYKREGTDDVEEHRTVLTGDSECPAIVSTEDVTLSSPSSEESVRQGTTEKRTASKQYLVSVPSLGEQVIASARKLVQSKLQSISLRPVEVSEVSSENITENADANKRLPPRKPLTHTKSFHLCSVVTPPIVAPVSLHSEISTGDRGFIENHSPATQPRLASAMLIPQKNLSNCDQELWREDSTSDDLSFAASGGRPFLREKGDGSLSGTQHRQQATTSQAPLHITTAREKLSKVCTTGIHELGRTARADVAPHPQENLEQRTASAVEESAGTPSMKNGFNESAGAAKITPESLSSHTSMREPLSISSLASFIPFVSAQKQNGSISYHDALLTSRSGSLSCTSTSFDISRTSPTARSRSGASPTLTSLQDVWSLHGECSAKEPLQPPSLPPPSTPPSKDVFLEKPHAFSRSKNPPGITPFLTQVQQRMLAQSHAGDRPEAAHQKLTCHDAPTSKEFERANKDNASDQDQPRNLTSNFPEKKVAASSEIVPMASYEPSMLIYSPSRPRDPDHVSPTPILMPSANKQPRLKTLRPLQNTLESSPNEVGACSHMSPPDHSDTILPYDRSIPPRDDARPLMLRDHGSPSEAPVAFKPPANSSGAYQSQLKSSSNPRGQVVGERNRVGPSCPPLQSRFSLSASTRHAKQRSPIKTPVTPPRNSQIPCFVGGVKASCLQCPGREPTNHISPNERASANFPPIRVDTADSHSSPARTFSDVTITAIETEQPHEQCPLVRPLPPAVQKHLPSPLPHIENFENTLPGDIPQGDAHASPFHSEQPTVSSTVDAFSKGSHLHTHPTAGTDFTPSNKPSPEIMPQKRDDYPVCGQPSHPQIGMQIPTPTAANLSVSPRMPSLAICDDELQKVATTIPSHERTIPAVTQPGSVTPPPSDQVSPLQHTTSSEPLSASFIPPRKACPATGTDRCHSVPGESTPPTPSATLLDATHIQRKAAVPTQQNGAALTEQSNSEHHLASIPQAALVDETLPGDSTSVYQNTPNPSPIQGEPTGSPENTKESPISGNEVTPRRTSLTLSPFALAETVVRVAPQLSPLTLPETSSPLTAQDSVARSNRSALPNTRTAPSHEKPLQLSHITVEPNAELGPNPSLPTHSANSRGMTVATSTPPQLLPRLCGSVSSMPNNVELANQDGLLMESHARIVSPAHDQLTPSTTAQSLTATMPANFAATSTVQDSVSPNNGRSLSPLNTDFLSEGDSAKPPSSPAKQNPVAQLSTTRLTKLYVRPLATDNLVHSQQSDAMPRSKGEAPCTQKDSPQASNQSPIPSDPQRISPRQREPHSSISQRPCSTASAHHDAPPRQSEGTLEPTRTAPGAKEEARDDQRINIRVEIKQRHTESSLRSLRHVRIRPRGGSHRRNISTQTEFEEQANDSSNHLPSSADIPKNYDAKIVSMNLEQSEMRTNMPTEEQEVIPSSTLPCIRESPAPPDRAEKGQNPQSPCISRTECQSRRISAAVSESTSHERRPSRVHEAYASLPSVELQSSLRSSTRESLPRAVSVATIHLPSPPHRRCKSLKAPMSGTTASWERKRPPFGEPSGRADTHPDNLRALSHHRHFSSSETRKQNPLPMPTRVPCDSPSRSHIERILNDRKTELADPRIPPRHGEIVGTVVPSLPPASIWHSTIATSKPPSAWLPVSTTRPVPDAPATSTATKPHILPPLLSHTNASPTPLESRITSSTAHLGDPSILNSTPPNPGPIPAGPASTWRSTSTWQALPEWQLLSSRPGLCTTTLQAPMLWQPSSSRQPVQNTYRSTFGNSSNNSSREPRVHHQVSSTIHIPTAPGQPSQPVSTFTRRNSSPTGIPYVRRYIEYSAPEVTRRFVKQDREPPTYVPLRSPNLCDCGVQHNYPTECRRPQTTADDPCFPTSHLCSCMPHPCDAKTPCRRGCIHRGHSCVGHACTHQVCCSTLVCSSTNLCVPPICTEYICTGRTCTGHSRGGKCCIDCGAANHSQRCDCAKQCKCPECSQRFDIRECGGCLDASIGGGYRKVSIKVER